MTETSRLLPARNKMRRKISGKGNSKKEIGDIENCKLQIEIWRHFKRVARFSIFNFQFSISALSSIETLRFSIFNLCAIKQDIH